YIESGALSVKNIDLPKKVKYKIRSSGSSEPADKAIYEGRTYKDLQAFLKEFPDTRITEMDTVLGCEGSHKALLTLHFSGCSFMMAYLLDSKESRHVKNVFDSIEHAIGTFSFASAFSLILTDRGGEFQIPDALECGEDNLIRTSIYYCDPMCSWQKPHCEKNHEYIRKICPKGTSFDNYSQKDINLIMSHINSTPRQSLGGLSPMALAKLMLPHELLNYFNLTEIPADEIVLTPALLKK
ncbi:IS30 family transposase, partial [Mediterraneibacter glycyrrhizinilyticus]|uniref:IS30 family transposase n=1 Tax=Mediterraneibacter glycyrrhizinilyticus TaxID=342942 RepID=UPI001D05E485